MTKSKMIALVATAALAAALALVGCGGSQTSSASASSAASSAAASSAAASTAASSAASTAASSAASTAASSAAASSAAASSAAAPASSAASSASDIGKDAAKEIALLHAGVAEDDCIELKIELDTDDAVIHYDVDFKAGGQEYDYDINPETGEIIKYDSEIDD